MKFDDEKLPLIFFATLFSASRRRASARARDDLPVEPEIIDAPPPPVPFRLVVVVVVARGSFGVLAASVVFCGF